MLSHSARPEGRSPRTRAVLAGWSDDEPTARSLLDHDDPSTRSSALSALERLGVLTLGDLEARAGDPSAAVRRRVARLAGRRDDAATVALGLLADEEPMVVEEAAFACGELVLHDARGDLQALASEHPDPLCREAAVASLGALGQPESLSTVLAAAADLPAIRRRAAIALAAFADDEQAIAMLRTLLEDRDWQVRQSAEDVLAAVDSTPPPN